MHFPVLFCADNTVAKYDRYRVSLLLVMYESLPLWSNNYWNISKNSVLWQYIWFIYEIYSFSALVISHTPSQPPIPLRLWINKIKYRISIRAWQVPVMEKSILVLETKIKIVDSFFATIYKLHSLVNTILGSVSGGAVVWQILDVTVSQMYHHKMYKGGFLSS